MLFILKDTLNVKPSLSELTVSPASSGQTAGQDYLPPFNPDLFQEINVGGRPVLAAKRYDEGEKKFLNTFPDKLIADDASGFVDAQPVVMTIPRGMYRTTHIGESLNQAKKRPLVNFPTQVAGTGPQSPIDNNCKAVMITLLDRCETVTTDQVKLTAQKQVDYEVRHFCSGYGKEGPQKCGGPVCECPQVLGLNAVKTSGQTEIGFFTVVYDWFDHVKTVEDEKEMHLEAFGNSAEPVDMVASVLPNRTVIWTPVFQLDKDNKRISRTEKGQEEWFTSQTEILEKYANDRAFEAGGLKFLDGVDFVLSQRHEFKPCNIE